MLILYTIIIAAVIITTILTIINYIIILLLLLLKRWRVKESGLPGNVVLTQAQMYRACKATVQGCNRLQTLHPQPQILNPQPSTPNPRP